VTPPPAMVRAEPEPETVPPQTPPCGDWVDAALAVPGLPGTPELDAARPRLLLYAKAEPVSFVQRPAAEAYVTEAARSYRTMLQRTSSPWSMLQRLTPVFAANVELARSVLLRDGYLYAEKPELAFALVDRVSAQLLFADKHIWVQRGERMLRAERTLTGHYAYVEGPERGEHVRLMLFDRIGTGEPPPALHRDFRSLRLRLGFDSVRIVHQTERTLVADLRYGASWVRSLLRADGARLELTCEDVPSGTDVAGQRRARAEQARLLEPLRRAMLEQVQEGLPFDEPRTEYGQQDGQLRVAWQRAYLAGEHDFEFNGDRYYVFNPRGEPLVPQVCIDFVFDTFERASGTWFRPRGQTRERVVGKLDFPSVTELNLRRANSIVELAKRQPEWFELHDVPERQRIPFKNGQELADYLVSHADEFRPGDIVLIRGYAPWDKPWKPRIMHMHSFFVYESDPLTGMPITLAGNPGQPVLQTWQFEAFRTPERSINHRVRPTTAWLERVIAAAETSPVMPPPLTLDPGDRKPALDVPTPPGTETEG